jgi:hypothetical protein
MSVIDRIHGDKILELEKKVEMLSYEIANLKIKVAAALSESPEDKTMCRDSDICNQGPCFRDPNNC